MSEERICAAEDDYFSKWGTCVGAVTVLNVHRLLLALSLVSAKLHDDTYFNNKVWAKIGGIPLNEMNDLEIKILSILPSLAIPAQKFREFIVYLLRLNCHNPVASQHHNHMLMSEQNHLSLLNRTECILRDFESKHHPPPTSPKSTPYEDDPLKMIYNVGTYLHPAGTPYCRCDRVKIFQSTALYWAKLVRLAKGQFDSRTTPPAPAIIPIPLKYIQRNENDQPPEWSPPPDAIHLLPGRWPTRTPKPTPSSPTSPTLPKPYTSPYTTSLSQSSSTTSSSSSSEQPAVPTANQKLTVTQKLLTERPTTHKRRFQDDVNNGTTDRPRARTNPFASFAFKPLQPETKLQTKSQTKSQAKSSPSTTSPSTTTCATCAAFCITQPQLAIIPTNNVSLVTA
jgi:hypothetical protein